MPAARPLSRSWVLSPIIAHSAGRNAGGGRKGRQHAGLRLRAVAAVVAGDEGEMLRMPARSRWPGPGPPSRWSPARGSGRRRPAGRAAGPAASPRPAASRRSGEDPAAHAGRSTSRETESTAASNDLARPGDDRARRGEARGVEVEAEHSRERRAPRRIAADISSMKTGKPDRTRWRGSRRACRPCRRSARERGKARTRGAPGCSVAGLLAFRGAGRNGVDVAGRACLVDCHMRSGFSVEARRTAPVSTCRPHLAEGAESPASPSLLAAQFFLSSPEPIGQCRGGRGGPARAPLGPPATRPGIGSKGDPARACGPRPAHAGDGAKAPRAPARGAAAGDRVDLSAPIPTMCVRYAWRFHR